MSYRGKKHYTEEQLKPLVAASTSKHEVLKTLGLPTKGTYGYRTLNYFLDLYRIDVSHFLGRAGGGTAKTAYKLEDIFAGKHPTYASGKLREKLLKERVFEHRCQACCNTEWCGRPIPLELDHINGKHWDHSRENLRLLCRNCHAQTDTFCGKNKGRKMDAPSGLEPLPQEPKSSVLPATPRGIK